MPAFEVLSSLLSFTTDAFDDRLNLMSNHSTADEMRTGFNRLICMTLCTPRLPNLFKCKNKFCTFVWFSVRSVLNIQLISVCHISNERKRISDQIVDLFIFE